MSAYQCPGFDWCENGFDEYPCRGEHFTQVSLSASMSAFQKSRVCPGVPVIVGVSFTPTEDVVPLISVTVGDDRQADMSLFEAREALAGLTRAIAIAEPLWKARPDVMDTYRD
ncbi:MULTISPECIES: hypothetical protein [Actinomycetes]|uniref:hypothetical protein n=1 Tax=Actinomycetes TaxID=1760 RepID=UPI0004C20657|nr:MULTISPECIES: hypothetical protein [Actinomycetes]